MSTFRVARPAFAQVPVAYLQTVLEAMSFNNERAAALPFFTDIYPLIEKSTGEITKDSPLFWIGGKDFESTAANDKKESIAFFVNRDNTTIEGKLARFNLSLVCWFDTDYFELNNRDVKAQIVAQIVGQLKRLNKITNLRVFTEKENILQPLGIEEGSFDFDARFSGCRLDFEIWDNTCLNGNFTSNKTFC